MIKENQPLISIIMASYNYSQFIERAIESVLNQTYKNWELLVVDDGSSDNSVEIIKKYSDQYKNIQLYQHKNSQNRGLAETLKLGLKKSKGKYIAFLESDDYWTTEHLSKKIEVINKYPEVKLFYNDVELFGDDNRLNVMNSYIKRCRLLSEKIKEPENISKYFIISTIIPTFSAMMVEKDILKKCDFNSPIVPYLDWWLGAQITFLTKAYYINEKLTHWQIHPQSYIGKTKNQIDRTQEKNSVKSLLNVLRKFDKKRYSYFLAEAIDYKLKIYNNEMLSTQKETLINSIKNKKTYLYGAGKFAQEIVEKFDLSEFNIKGFIDIDKSKKGSLIGKYEVFHKDEISDLNPEIIILTVADPSLIYFDILSYMVNKNIKAHLIPNIFEIQDSYELAATLQDTTPENILKELII